VKAGKGELVYSKGYAVGRGRVSTQLIFRYLQATGMRYRFK
jgi:hypothetical protein